MVEQVRQPLRLGVMISGSGSNLQALIDAIAKNELPQTEIALVISNKADAYGVQRALDHQIPVIYLPWKPQGGSEDRLVELLRLFEVDLVVLAGWMRILSEKFVSQFPERIINLHPALLPDDGAGDAYVTSDGSTIPVFRGLHAARQAIQAGVHVTGSTVHYVIPTVDAGPAICRVEVPIQPGDTEETLQERIKQEEHRLIVEAIKKYQVRHSF